MGFSVDDVILLCHNYNAYPQLNLVTYPFQFISLPAIIMIIVQCFAGEGHNMTITHFPWQNSTFPQASNGSAGTILELVPARMAIMTAYCTGETNKANKTANC